jgi:tetratricopeptide (TPR) repeat protein
MSRTALEVGIAALHDARWDAARRRFEEALAEEETADARDGLGQSLWFLGRVEEGVAARERALEAYARTGRADEAARAAVWVSHQYLVSGRSSAARGWLSRAERVLEGCAVCAEHGWVAVERARHAGLAEECAGHARRAMVIARDCRAPDLEVFALSLLGRAAVGAGRRAEGMALLEEAMAAAAAGRVRNLHTLGEAYCNLVIACTAAGEWERAAEWCELVDEFARTNDLAPLLGGKAERFIRTMLAGWAYGAIYRDSRERTAALDGWLWTYNHRRRHSAIGRQPPITRLNNLLGSYT